MYEEIKFSLKLIFTNEDPLVKLAKIYSLDLKYSQTEMPQMFVTLFFNRCKYTFFLILQNLISLHIMLFSFSSFMVKEYFCGFRLYGMI